MPKDDATQLAYDTKYSELVSKAAVRTERQKEAGRIYKQDSPEHKAAILKIDEETIPEIELLKSEVNTLKAELDAL